jgi:hypothetical protein
MAGVATRVSSVAKDKPNTMDCDSGAQNNASLARRIDLAKLDAAITL